MSNTPVQIYDLTDSKLIAEFSTPHKAEKAFNKGIPGINSKHTYAIITVHKTLCVENIDVVWEDTTEEFLNQERADIQKYQADDGLDIDPPVTQAESLNAAAPAEKIAEEPEAKEEPTAEEPPTKEETVVVSIVDTDMDNELDDLEADMAGTAPAEEIKEEATPNIADDVPDGDEPVLDDAEFGFGDSEEDFGN